MKDIFGRGLFAGKAYKILQQIFAKCQDSKEKVLRAEQRKEAGPRREGGAYSKPSNALVITPSQLSLKVAPSSLSSPCLLSFISSQVCLDKEPATPPEHLGFSLSHSPHLPLLLFSTGGRAASATAEILTDKWIACFPQLQQVVFLKRSRKIKIISGFSLQFGSPDSILLGDLQAMIINKLRRHS